MNTVPSRRAPRRAFAGLVACVSLLAGVGAGYAQPVKNIVLVHGAFADGSSWSRVIPLLQAKGYHVTAVQIPLTSFADDVAATQRAIARENGPAILVGHSWGGVVITEAGMDPKVVGLVYVAAFAPDQGEQVGELGKKYPAPPALASPSVDDKGFLTLSADAFKKFGNDLPEKEAFVACATQGPISASAFAAQVSGVAWKTKPTWYIVSTIDQAIAPDEERFFAKRMKATTTELKASHVSMLSQPKAVSGVIMDAAQKAQGATAMGEH
jgi:pimeloyl-ACP methyl ester carboxylesterase